MAQPAKKTPVVAVTLTAPTAITKVTLRRWTLAARRRLPKLKGDVSIVTISPAVSRRLNKKYRHKNRPTNVLSFEHGEILLCPAVIQREAREQGIPYKTYFHFLLVHGLIHLLGLDHHSPSEYKRWQRYERLLDQPHP